MFQGVEGLFKERELKEYKKYDIFEKEHFLYNCDFMEVAKTLPDKSQHLIIADPPYFEVKGDFDFIWASFDDYLKDVNKWAIELKRILADNGTLFWWGHAKKIAYSQIILDKYFNLENHLKWRKTDCQTRIGYEGFNSFPPTTEHLLMYSQDSVNLTECIYHIRSYIREEITKSKGRIILKEVNIAFGTATNGGGVASACLSLEKKEPTMITKEMYLKLQEWCTPFLRKEYEELRKEYEELRKEYEELRRPFNNYGKFDDVLDFAQDVHLTGKYKHPTQKSPSLTRAIVKTCSKKGQNMFIPFGGSGTETEVGINEGLKVIVCEMEEKHCITIDKRIEAETQQQTLFQEQP